MTVNRNYPQERGALDQLDEALLNVWLNGGGALSRAAQEILFSRFWLDHMGQDIWRGDQLVAKALKAHQSLMHLVNELRTSLESKGDQVLVEKIDKVMLVRAATPDEA